MQELSGAGTEAMEKGQEEGVGDGAPDTSGATPAGPCQPARKCQEHIPCAGEAAGTRWGELCI